MNTLQIAEGELEVSRLCLGTMQLGIKAKDAEMEALLDSYIENGGNFFDTAHIYCAWHPGGDGLCERLLGSYIQKRGLRDNVVIATKGGHPGVKGYRIVESYLSPERIAADIDDSLGRLRIDYADLYWLHRDDPRIPVAEIIDYLNSEIDKGRIKHLGASNWTTPRIAEANAYAEAKGLKGFSASQPCWHIDCEVEQPSGEDRFKPGVLLIFSHKDREWHATSQLPVIPFSSTARGFFANKPQASGKHETLSLERWERVDLLSSEMDVSRNQLVLAWLLCQPFPVIPILGTSKSEHLEDAMGSIDINLSPEQLDWLENGGDKP